MKLTRRTALVALGGAAALVLSAGPSLATECVNASKPLSAGNQVILSPAGVVWTTPGLANRFAQGLVDPETGEGFHGLVGFDFDGDGAVDFSTYVVGPGDEIPELAQFNGPACHGVTNIGIYFSECVG